MKKPKLSICIPTYNRGKIVYSCVIELLQYSGDDIEVIVSNNASTDETNELMLSICDNRLVYVSNTENLGPTRNFFITMELVRSDFFYLISDEDRLEVTNFPHFIDLITKHPSAAGVAGGRSHIGKDFTNISKDFRIYKKGFDALDKFGFTHSTYMAPFIFNKNLIDFNYPFSKLYTLVEIGNNLCSEGDIISTPQTLCYRGVETGVVDSESIYLYDSVAFFEPNGRIDNLYRLNVCQLSTYRLSKYEKFYFHIKIIVSLKRQISAYNKLDASAFAYYKVKNNKKNLSPSEVNKKMYSISDPLLLSNNSFIVKQLIHTIERIIVKEYIKRPIRVDKCLRFLLRLND